MLQYKQTNQLSARKEIKEVVKISRAPNNFYTAAEAAKKLGMPKTTFHSYVKSGKISKVVPPGQVEGYYPKKEIDKMVKARELFILEYASEPSSFTIASENDIKGIHDLSTSLFGITNTTSYETMLSWQKKNPQTYYVVKQEGIVTGYLGLLYLNQETTEYILAAKESGRPQPTATEVLPFTPNEPIEGLWVGIGVMPGLTPLQARQHARHLISGGIEVLEELAKKGNTVKKLYATSETNDGIRLSRKIGFKETIYPGEPLIRYELDLLKSDSPLLREYQTIVKQTTIRYNDRN